MSRLLLYGLLAVVFAVTLGSLMVRDPGYALIAYGEYSLQTSLWVLIAVVLALLLALLALIRLIEFMVKGPGRYRAWRVHREEMRLGSVTLQGLTLWLQGEFDRARRYLEGGTRDRNATGIGHLAAAREAAARGDAEGRETRLRLAREAGPNLAVASRVVAAELALARGDHADALTLLAEVPTNDHVLGLRKAALVGAEDWRGMLALVPALAKANGAQAHDMEINAGVMGLESLKGDDAALTALRKSLSSKARHDARVTLAYARALADQTLAERTLRKAIERDWQESLVVAYGDIGGPTLETRRKRAEAWRTAHAASPALQYCLGAIYAQAQEVDKAIEALTRATSLGGSADVHLRLAELLSGKGDHAAGIGHYRLAAQSLNTKQER